MARPESMARRERLVMAGGATVVALALVLTYVLLPLARAWQTRALAIDAAAQRVQHLTELVSRTSALESSAANAERTLAAQPRRVVHARSTTLAASAVQSLLQEGADGSSMVMMRLDVSANDTAGSAAGIPTTFSAYGDIVGATTLLELLTRGPRVITLERLTLQRNSALAGAADVVQVMVTARVPVVPE